MPIRRAQIRKDMSVRARERIFMEFERWGFDERGWLPNTRDKYYRTVVIADHWLQQNRGRSLLWATTRDMKAWLFSTTPDPRSRNNRRQALVAFGAFMLAQEMGEVNHALGLPRLQEPRALPKALTAQEARALLVVAPAFGPMANAMMHMFLYAGLRLTECRTLKWVYVEEAWLRFKGKRQKEREIPLHPDAVAALRRWEVHEQSAEWIFPSPFNSSRPLSKTTAQEIVRKVGRAAGIEGLYPHILRHTSATMLLEATSDLRTVQEFLGHSSPAVTAIYTRIRPTRLREAVNRLTFEDTTPTESR